MNHPLLEPLKRFVLAGNVPSLIETLFQLALDVNASDIHIEPLRSIVRVRIRIDGLLRLTLEYPQNLHPSIASKLKIMANLKIDESRIPQDGRVNTFIGDTEVDLRLSTLPTPNGEKIVMRVLDKSKTVPDLPDLGITGRNLSLIEDAIAQPNGIILTSGPTGSGKTTTLYSCLARLNTSERNIMTFEDPIENQMDGLNQSQVRPDIGYSFANGLRTALRQDPDIIMVGEIRDRETIDIAIEASLTGHLVLSTIHTNSAVETLTRILNMGVPDFLLASSVNLIIAQRLARRLVPEHTVRQAFSPDAQSRLQTVFEHFTPWPDFDQSLFDDPHASSPHPDTPAVDAYRGRVGLYEVMPVTPAIKKAILQGQPAFEIERIAIDEGMVTLEQDGVLKVLEGLTSLDEVYKLVKNS